MTVIKIIKPDNNIKITMMTYIIIKQMILKTIMTQILKLQKNIKKIIKMEIKI